MKTKPYPVWCGIGLLAAWLTASSAQATVRVYGLASSSGEFITAQIYADIATTPIISYSFKVYYDAALLQVAQAVRNDAVWSLFDGLQPLAYQKPEASQAGEVWFLGGKLDALHPGDGVQGTGVLLGTVIFKRLNSSVPDFNLTIGRPGQFANFVTREGLSLDALPGEVTFAGILPTSRDRDLDGLEDKWEIKYFGDYKLSYYSDDGDKDSIDNLGEQALGSDPTDEESNLRLAITRESKGVRIEWTSFDGRYYTIEGSDDLPKFQALKSGIPATMPNNTFDLPIGSRKNFYRIQLDNSR